MIKLSIEEIIEKIRKEETFHAVAFDYSFVVKIDDYVPFFAAAVHDGHHFDASLWSQCLHSEYERRYEEDPATGQMISDTPITLIGLDSRFEYDLNRAPDTAIYDSAWGKKLWSTPLSRKQKEQQLQKHNNFYRVVKALSHKLEEMYPAVVVYDMHSYNYKRWDREVPVFNIGTSNVDEDRYRVAITEWQEMLDDLPLPIDQEVRCNINDVFQGNGYFLKFITANTQNTLVLATEISKIYCNELTGQLFPDVIKSVQDLLRYYIKSHAHNFQTTYGLK
ncbi:N-formylglutamate amidohydrolase [Nonlabens sp. SY33080]|uniref:N-formylglutamate amidohydrolase n=1 Tax=Nonlabens sp. SY33080 TaxID=2719911 RepID=UPI001428AC23|nr:N-formylglutamate amidohydrolase [Nonlabens sp. SY33080]